jgi:hypothetical protein
MIDAIQESPHLPQRLKDLRTALAVNRGMEAMDKVKLNISPEDFNTIHDQLFQDWQNQPGFRNIDIQQDGEREQRKATAREQLRKAFNRFRHKLIDPNVAGASATGFFLDVGDHKECAKVLARFYSDVRQINGLFDYGNNLTLDYFMAALGKRRDFQAVYGDGGIDFRRIDGDDFEALHSKDPSGNALKKAFLHALDPKRNPKLDNKKSGYPALPSNQVEISEINFLAHTDGEGKKYLVTMNGGLVRLTKEVKRKVEAQLRSNKILADIDPITTDQLAKGEDHQPMYLPGTEELRQGYSGTGEKFIDGFRTTAKEAPLVCLDADILTGLRKPSLDKLNAMLKKCDPTASIFSLNKNKKGGDDRANAELLAKLNKEAEKEPTPDDIARAKRSIQVAYEHLNHVTDRLDELKNEIFKGDGTDKHKPKNKATGTPQLYVSMGGAASGKSNVTKMAVNQLGEDNVVVASLDEYRTFSKLHKLLIAAKHHADDYKLTSPFGNALREWVTNYAKAERYNLVFDGSGIDYKDPSKSMDYAKRVADFKKSGFKTQVVAYDRDYEEAVYSADKRLGTEQRGMPWKMMLEKHSRTPFSVIQAVNDPNLDKFSLFANDNDRFLVAETFDMAKGDLANLEQQPLNGVLKDYLANMAKTRPDGILQDLATGKIEKQKRKAAEATAAPATPTVIPAKDDLIKQLLERVPTYKKDKEHNAVYLSLGKKDRVLAVYDVDRFVKVLEKSRLNPDAAGLENVNVPSKTLAFLADKPSTWKDRAYKPFDPEKQERDKR